MKWALFKFAILLSCFPASGSTFAATFTAHFGPEMARVQGVPSNFGHAHSFYGNLDWLFYQPGSPFALGVAMEGGVSETVTKGHSPQASSLITMTGSHWASGLVLVQRTSSRAYTLRIVRGQTLSRCTLARNRTDTYEKGRWDNLSGDIVAAEAAVSFPLTGRFEAVLASRFTERHYPRRSLVGEMTTQSAGPSGLSLSSTPENVDAAVPRRIGTWGFKMGLGWFF